MMMNSTVASALPLLAQGVCDGLNAARRIGLLQTPGKRVKKQIQTKQGGGGEESVLAVIPPYYAVPNVQEAPLWLLVAVAGAKLVWDVLFVSRRRKTVQEKQQR